MVRHHKRGKAPGLAPGTLVHTGDRHAAHTKISLINFHGDDFQEHVVNRVEDVFAFRDSQTVTWIDVVGLHDTELIQDLGSHFGLHPLLLEDVVSIDQRPKVEDYDDYVFIVAKLLSDHKGLYAEQVSIVLGKNYVITFCERSSEVFLPVLDRIRAEKSRIREKGADYLAYALIDTLVDNYFIVLEGVSERVGLLEESALTNPGQRTMRSIQDLKREMALLHRHIWPLREVVNQLLRGENSLFHKGTLLYLRDVHDHTVQLIDTITSLREMIGGILDIYLTSVNNRMNEVMKVLTIIATIFIPLTFVTGVYGMNFRFMPELYWRYGYLFSLGLMAVIAGWMILFFRRKKWF